MIINIPYDNVEMIKSQHEKMKAWNENMVKQHEAAAMWHQSKIEEFEKVMVNVPPAEKVSAPSAGSPQGEPTDVGGSPTSSMNKVPLDPMKKQDLVEILEDHAAQYGDFSKSIEEIVQYIID